MIHQQQLFHILRNTIEQANTTESEIEKKNLLGSANLLVNELLLRDNLKFYLDFYSSGHEFASEGVALCESLGMPITGMQESLLILPTALEENVSPDFALAKIDLLWDIQSKIVALLPTGGDTEIQSYLDRLNEWEVKVYAYRETLAPTPEMELIEEVAYSKESFLTYLQSKKPEWKNLKIHDFFQIGGGFSKITLLMDLEDDLNGKHSIAVRAQPAMDTIALLNVKVENEFSVVQLAYKEGITVAEPLWLEDDATQLGAKFIVSRRAPGKNLGTAVGATDEVTNSMVASLAEESAKIHNIDLSASIKELKESALSEWCDLETIEQATQKNVAFWREIVAKSGMSTPPLVERGFRWLEDNIEPCQERPSLLHCDIGLHNVLIENGKVSAVLDWEVSTIGDPARDLSWTLQCTDEFVTREQLLDLYYQAGGKPVSEFRLRYHDVMMCITMPIAALGMAKSLEKRLDSPQYAVFALRFMHHNSSRLVSSIKAAEAAKNW